MFQSYKELPLKVKGLLRLDRLGLPNHGTTNKKKAEITLVVQISLGLFWRLGVPRYCIYIIFHAVLNSLIYHLSKSGKLVKISKFLLYFLFER